MKLLFEMFWPGHERNSMRTAKKVVFLFPLTVMAVCGCESMGVEPWERDILSKDEMQLTVDPVEAGIDDHIYFSKEASSGGRGFGGGGCGCN
jgi:hypothetical protein